MVRRSVFDRIFQEIKQIRYRLDDIESEFSKWDPQPVKIAESKLFSLPDHLRKSYIAVSAKGECSALEASILTGRCRSIESNYLNQLMRMGWLTKKRDSKSMSFRVVPEEVLKEGPKQT